jgi:FKBP-type peptidyl-prolyl cis-trans isomerase FklB
MKKVFLIAILANSSFCVLAQPKKTVAKPTTVAKPSFLKNLKDSASYALGFNVGQNILQKYKDLNPEILSKAIKDAMSSKAPLLDANQTNQCMNSYMAMQQKGKSEGAKKIGAKFLEDNKKRPGVITTASGLQYQVITQGTGPKPIPTDMVKVNYAGSLINGKEFDASAKHGGPAQFGVGGVIAGWTEVLQLMPVGSKYKVYIPSSLAYQDFGAGEDIGPGETLIFEIELLEIVKAPETPKEEPKQQQ